MLFHTTRVLHFSGEMVNSPVYYLGFVAGYTTAYYDETESVLQIYFQGFAQSRQYTDVQFPGPYPSGLHVSPVAEGSDYAIDPHKDGRSDVYMKETQPADDNGVGLGLFTKPSDNPDFTLWRRPRSDTCLGRYENGGFWEELELNEKDLNQFESALFKLKILKGLVGKKDLILHLLYSKLCIHLLCTRFS